MKSAGIADVEMDKLFEREFAFTHNPPLFCSLKEIALFGDFLSSAIDIIVKTNEENIRVIVIEAWLIIDYTIRHILGAAFNLQAFHTDKFDPLYKILPSSFDTCLMRLELILNEQRALPIRPEKKFPHISSAFEEFIKVNYQDTCNKLKEIKGAFIEKLIIEEDAEWKRLHGNSPMLLVDETRYCSDPGWVQKLSDLDEKCFQSVRRLNKARNAAAHTYNTDKILKAFGFNGNASSKKLKAECLNILKKPFKLKL